MLAMDGKKTPAKDSIVAAIGEKTHIIKCENVTKQDDLVSQRHKKNWN